MARIRAVLFDFGGTLCTFGAVEGAARANARLIAGWFGLSGDGETERVFAVLQRGVGQAFREYAGRPFFLHRDLFATGYRYALTELAVPYTEEQIGRAVQQFWRNREAETRLRAGAVETLAELRRRGIITGIVSNTDEVELQIALAPTGLQDLVDFALSSEAAGSCKPDAGIFREALRHAACDASEALFVGDTADHDVLGANHAGIRSVLLRPPEILNLPWPRGDAQPTHVISALPEVLALIDGAGK